MFDPVVEWLEQRLGTKLRVDDSIMGAEQGPEAIQAVRDHLSGKPHARMTCPPTPLVHLLTTHLGTHPPRTCAPCVTIVA